MHAMCTKRGIIVHAIRCYPYTGELLAARASQERPGEATPPLSMDIEKYLL